MTDIKIDRDLLKQNIDSGDLIASRKTTFLSRTWSSLDRLKANHPLLSVVGKVTTATASIALFPLTVAALLTERAIESLTDKEYTRAVDKIRKSYYAALTQNTATPQGRDLKKQHLSEGRGHFKELLERAAKRVISSSNPEETLSEELKKFINHPQLLKAFYRDEEGNLISLSEDGRSLILKDFATDLINVILEAKATQIRSALCSSKTPYLLDPEAIRDFLFALMGPVGIDVRKDKIDVGGFIKRLRTPEVIAHLEKQEALEREAAKNAQLNELDALLTSSMKLSKQLQEIAVSIPQLEEELTLLSEQLPALEEEEKTAREAATLSPGAQTRLGLAGADSIEETRLLDALREAEENSLQLKSQIEAVSADLTKLHDLQREITLAIENNETDYRRQVNALLKTDEDFIGDAKGIDFTPSDTLIQTRQILQIETTEEQPIIHPFLTEEGALKKLIEYELRKESKTEGLLAYLRAQLASTYMDDRTEITQDIIDQFVDKNPLLIADLQSRVETDPISYVEQLIQKLIEGSDRLEIQDSSGKSLGYYALSIELLNFHREEEPEVEFHGVLFVPTPKSANGTLIEPQTPPVIENPLVDEAPTVNDDRLSLSSASAHELAQRDDLPIPEERPAGLEAVKRFDNTRFRPRFKWDHRLNTCVRI